MIILRESDIGPILTTLSRPQAHSLLLSLWRSLSSYSTQSSSSQDAATIHQPMRETIHTSSQNTSLFMPASDTTSTTGLKVVTLPGSGGAPRGAICIFHPEGELQGVLNAELITAFRTALAAMLPFVWHGCREGSEVLVFGAGKQAEWHVRLVLLLKGESVRRVTVVNRGRKGVDKLRGELESVVAAYPRVEIEYHSREDAGFTEDTLREVVGRADAMFCCTPSTEPLFSGEYLVGEKRRFISCIGSYKPHMQEIDSAALLSGGKNGIMVDSKEACLMEAGELIMAGVKADQLVEVGELDVPRALEGGGEQGKGNTVFKCVGMGVMDLVVGRELLNIAAEKGVGVTVDEF